MVASAILVDRKRRGAAGGAGARPDAAPGERKTRRRRLPRFLLSDVSGEDGSGAFRIAVDEARGCCCNIIPPRVLLVD